MTELAKYEAAERALSEADSVDEVLEIRSQAEAWRAYAKQAKTATSRSRRRGSGFAPSGAWAKCCWRKGNGRPQPGQGRRRAAAFRRFRYGTA